MSQTVDPLSPETTQAVHTWLILFRAFQAIRQIDLASIQQLRIHDRPLSGSEFGILEVLLHKGPLPINTIGEKILLTSGSMTAAVDRLSGLGLVARVADPVDRRVRRVSLTSEGEIWARRLFAQHAHTLASLMGVLSPQEQAQLQELLKKIGHHAAQGLHAGPRPTS
jgi:MarR family transcriptional regulator, 2-MHQ and catechol-resistance regulon repressor